MRAAFSIASGGTPVTLRRASRGSYALHRRGDGLEAGGVRVDERAILEAVAQDHVQHAHQQREIGAGPHRQVQIGVARDRRHARIGDDQLAAVVAAAPDVVGGDRRALADVGADRRAAPAAFGMSLHGIGLRSTPNASL